MKRSLLTLAATSLIAVSAVSTAQAGPLDNVLRPSIKRIGDYTSPTEGNYLPEAFSKSVILSGRYCQGLPFNANFYHVALDFDQIDSSSSQTNFKALAHVKFSSSEKFNAPALEERLYTVKGQYKNGKFVLDTAEPILASDRNKAVKPTLLATPGRFVSYAPQAGVNEQTHLNIERHPAGVTCYSANLVTDEKYSTKQRKELIANLKKKQDKSQNLANAPTMFFNTIAIGEKNSQKKVDQALKKIGAKYVSTTSYNAHRKDVYDVSETIPGTSQLTATYTELNGTDYLYILQLEIPASAPGTAEADMPVVQTRDALLKKYGKPVEGNASVKAAWKRHDGALIMFQVTRNYASPASANLFYLNNDLMDENKQKTQKAKKSAYGKL